MGGEDEAVLASLLEDDHVRGDPSAPVIVLYGDFECPYTRAAYRAVQTLEHRGNALRLVFRHFPLTEIHPHALHAALAAEAASAQGRYWEMHDVLFRNRTALEDSDLMGYAAGLELDEGAFRASLDASSSLARVERDVRSGAAAGVNGIPAVFVAGARVASYRANDLEPLLAGAGEDRSDG